MPRDGSSSVATGASERGWLVKLGWRSLTARAGAAREWYRFRNHADSTEIMIYDEIGGWGIPASDFVRDLASVTSSSITVRMNTPGGEIFDGIAIYNALRSHPANVTTVVEGLAASIGSVILQAGDKRLMMSHSQTMIHDGSGMCWGNAADMRQLADLLDKLSNNIAGVYAERSGQGDVASWRASMLAESWYSADEAVAAGLADASEPPEPLEPPEPDEPGDPGDPDMKTNRWDMSVFRYHNRAEAPSPLTAWRKHAPADEPQTNEPTFDADAFRAALSALKG